MKAFTLFVMTLAVLFASCTCGPPQCTPGANGCACKAGNVCDTGLVCASDKCGTAVTIGVEVSDATARGCEFLLTEAAGTEVKTVDFKNGAKGSWVREAPKVAVTVVANGDTSLNGGVSLGLSGAASGLAVSKVSCVDLKGARLTSTLTIK